MPKTTAHLSASPTATISQRPARQNATETFEATAVRSRDGVTAASGDGLVKRAEAARLLGVSVSTLRRLEGSVISPSVDEHGHHVFHVAQLDAVRVKYRRTGPAPDPNAIDGDTAADVFAMLDDGQSTIDVVKALRLTPDLVEQLHIQWVRMKKGVFVDGMSLAELNRVLSRIVSVPALTDGRSLLDGFYKIEAKLISPDQVRFETRCRACINGYELEPKRAVLCLTCADARAAASADPEKI